jgi:hypothetical protein
MRSSVLILLLSLRFVAACARPHAATDGVADWRLVYPPEMPDEHYPKGVHLVGAAPLSEWTGAETFASRDACEAARVREIDDTIDRARVEHGDAAKFELPVRRAVNARCVGTP